MAEQPDLSRLTISRDESPSGRPPGKPRVFLYYLGGAVVLGAVLFYFLRSVFSAEEVVEVTTAALVSPSQASSLLTASGYVVAQRKAAIASKATGRIVSLEFKEGDRVRKGEIIATIESADVEAALAQARADLQVVQADLHDANQTLTRANQLLERNLISQSEFDAAKARYDRTLATIASREANLRAAEVQVENTRIRAPFDGTILTKNADVGEVVAPFAAGASSRVAVVTIADMQSLEVEADVSESNIDRIRASQPCEIVLDAYPDKRYQGVVDKIVPTADRAKATVMTKIRFLDKDGRVLPEMSAKVYFLAGNADQETDRSPRLVVDPAAVATRDGRKVAFILRENVVSETPLALGNTLGRLVEVKSGLAAGDKVVLRPTESLRSGMKIKLKQ